MVRMPSGESLGVSCCWRGGRRWSAVSQDGEFTRVSTKSFWPITRFGLGGSIPAIRQGRQRRSERSRRRQTGGQEAETNRLRPLSTKPLPTAATRRRALASGHLAVVREADPGRTFLTEDAVLPVHGEVLGAGSPP